MCMQGNLVHTVISSVEGKSSIQIRKRGKRELQGWEGANFVFFLTQWLVTWKPALMGLFCPCAARWVIKGKSLVVTAPPENLRSLIVQYT